MANLQGMTILVTGAGSGIGREAARLFAQSGASLILLGRRLEALRETLPGARCVALDHGDAEAVAAFAADCPALHGMFLNAGQFESGTVQGSPVALFDRMISANLRGPWLLCHHLGPKLLDRGSVVLTGSNIGIRALPNAAAYGVAKAGLHMLAQVLAVEWAARGIRCNAIAPGPILTEMVRARFEGAADPAAKAQKLGQVNPLGRLGLEIEVAQLAAHLLGPDSAWTTGAVIPIDGGATAAFWGQA